METGEHLPKSPSNVAWRLHDPPVVKWRPPPRLKYGGHLGLAIGGEDLQPVEGNVSGWSSAAQHLANGRLLGQCLAYLACPGYHFGQSGSKRYGKQKGAYGRN